jgi:hypothetical protein
MKFLTVLGLNVELPRISELSPFAVLGLADSVP